MKDNDKKVYPFVLAMCPAANYISDIIYYWEWILEVHMSVRREIRNVRKICAYIIKVLFTNWCTSELS